MFPQKAFSKNPLLISLSLCLCLFTGQVFAIDTDGDIAVYRYESNGALDTSFSGDGVAIIDLGDEDSGVGITQLANS